MRRPKRRMNITSKIITLKTITTPQMYTSSKICRNMISNTTKKTTITINEIMLISIFHKIITMMQHKNMIWIPSRTNRELITLYINV